MSKPTDGTYYIVNHVLSPSGDRLAITFNGQSQTATVEPLTNAASQQWKISTFDANTQSVVPQSSSNLQAAWGSGVVTVLPAGAYVWTIRSTSTGYTIQDGGVTQNWGVNNANTDSQVTISFDAPREAQRWILVKV